MTTLRDLKATASVGFQVDFRNRVWVCVDGQCVLRVVGAKVVEITDLRHLNAQDLAETAVPSRNIER